MLENHFYCCCSFGNTLCECLQVLKSHMIPATATDEQVTDLLRAMPEHPGMYERIVDALFAESSSSGIDEPPGGVRGSSDGDVKPIAQLSVNSDITAAGVPVASNSAVQLSIMRCVERVCSAHSCLQMQSRVVRCYCCCCLLIDCSFVTAAGVACSQ